MNESAALQLAVILFFGIAAQWIAWRTKAPSIIMLILIGFLMGPVTGVLKPDELLGPILLPLVSFSLAIILYSGGLNLNIRELRNIGLSMLSYVFLGSIISWGIISWAAYALLGFELKVAVLFGAMLVVTGPTVIMPIIAQIRPSGMAGKMLKWEGILIGPIGASLAVLVFEVIMAHGDRPLNSIIFEEIIQTIAAGAAAGAAAAYILVLIIKKYWVPDFLQNPVSLALLLAAFAAANYFQSDSGLLAAVVMGVILSSQKIVDIRQIAEFKDNLRLLLISCLLIILSARLPMEAVMDISGGQLIFLGVLIFAARPASVFISTLFAPMKTGEKFFLAALAPRGIIAAAVASVFEMRLSEAGFQTAGFLNTAFLAIAVTIVFYGLIAVPLAKKTGVARLNPQGLLVAGASRWIREIIKPLRDEKFRVILVDSNSANVTTAKVEGFEAVYGNILDAHITDRINTEDTGRLIAMTSNDEVNMLACSAFSPQFGSENVYRLFSDKETVNLSKGPGVKVKGRLLFGANASHSILENRISQGWQVKKSVITKEFTYARHVDMYGNDIINLFIISKAKELSVMSKDGFREPKEGEALISVVPPKKTGGIA